MQDAMQETMDAIEYGSDSAVSVNKKDSLLSDISKLENEIQQAVKLLEQTDRTTPLYAAITPEQANLNRRNIVFLRKDLDSKRSEYDELLN
jgi:hypothetical protein